MAKIIEMSQLSPTMTEGVLAKWRKNEGEKVGPGDALAEVETDKANMDLEAFDRGVLLARLVPEGAAVKVGAPIAIVGEPGEDVSALVAEAKGSGGGAAKAPAKDAPRKEAPAKASKGAPADEPAAEEAASREAAKEAAPRKAPATKTEAAPARRDGERVFASPLARAIAKEQGLDVGSLTGSGPHGRIVKRDVEAAVQDGGKRPAGGTPEWPDFQDVPLSPMRKTIARRLVESKQKVPHFYLTVECDAAPIKAFRAQANEGVPDEEKISLNDVILKCVARALRLTPQANASYIEEDGQEVFRQWRRVHVGIAVALEGGLITPVVRDADLKRLSTIAAETKDLIARARAKKLKPDEYTGGTISVSNLGMYGVDEFSAIVNPPESTILALGQIAAKPVVAANGAIVVGERMRMTLSCDHRVVDGALGAQLLQRIKEIIEHPAKAVI
ncbi:pyruvate dehydrogenase complex dihydrolipoamide acetyltransferase [bacterium]|nr:pyruvate dehydrogenase complex dihydrolipoamide acetyltransferase [bacterium]